MAIIKWISSNKNLQLIIGLMIVAVLGLISLQYYWIKRSYTIANDQFESVVIDALNQISKGVSENEINSIAENFMKEQSPTNGACVKNTQMVVEKPLKISPLFKNLSNLTLDFSKISPNCTCQNCIRDVYYEYMREYFKSKTIVQTPVIQRVSKEQLKANISSELKKRGIDLEFVYSVFDLKSSEFTILGMSNDSMAIENPRNALKISKYKVPLFSIGNSFPAQLTIFFPNKNFVLFRSIWPILLVSTIFISVVFFVFYYAVNTILNQKKLADIKNDFINNMTHEFKTPIATISLATDSINNQNIINDPGKIKKFTDIIKQENKRMLSQVDKVLQAALMERKELDLTLSSCDIHKIINSAVTNISLQLEKRNGTIETQLEATDCEIFGDETHLSNMFNNLLDNANKYSPATPSLSVFTKNKPGGIIIKIQDKGKGMSKEQTKQIFEKFFRVSTGDRHDVKGHGLGLTYVQTIVQAHKGTITVQSEIGKGSIFIIELNKNC